MFNAIATRFPLKIFDWWVLESIFYQTCKFQVHMLWNFNTTEVNGDDLLLQYSLKLEMESVF